MLILSPSINPLGVKASESSASSVASPDTVGFASSEEENIDSFDVNPSNRWTIIDDDSDIDSVVVGDSYLNITDIGDGSTDTYHIGRNLRDLDGVIETRFMIQSNGSSGTFNDDFGIFLDVDADNDDSHRVFVQNIKSSSTSTILAYDDINDDTQIKSDIDNIVPGAWYIYRLDYDLLKSELRARLFFDNGIKVWDHEWQEISSETPGTFDETSLNVRFLYQVTTNTNTQTLLIDYIKAPFKEREWTQSDIPSDSDFLADGWGMVRIQDDIASDDTKWDLVVPYLDATSATLHMNTTDNDVFVSDDAEARVLYSFQVFGVDADDGDLHEIMKASITMFEIVAGTIRSELVANIAGIDFAPNMIIDHASGYTDVAPAVDFVLSLEDDRERITCLFTFWPNFADRDVFFSFQGTGLVSDVVTDPSQEFLLRTHLDVDSFEPNVELYAYLSDVSVTERDIFSDLGGFIDDVIGGAQDFVGGGTDIFTAIFRWVVSVITDFLAFMLDLLLAGLTLISSAITALQGVIVSALTTLQTAVDNIFSAIGDVVTELQGLASDVATAIWDGVGSALDFIVDAVDGLWDALIAILDDIIGQLLLLAEDVADFLFAAIEFLVVLLLTIVEELWTILEGIVFFIWDAIGLPDALALGNELLVYTIELVDWLLVTFLDVVDFFNDLSWLILVIWWAWAIPIQWARADFNPIGGVANFIEVYFYDALPWSIIGVHIYVPQGIIFTLWLLLLLPGDFALFTAMG